MSGPPGRNRLLNAAERLFAEQGVDATSARAINAAADLSPAALHYHFGNKERIVEEVLTRRMDELSRQRTEMLTGAIAAGRTVDGRLIAEILVTPTAEFALGNGREGRWYIRFLSRMFTEKPNMIFDFVEKKFGEGFKQLGELVAGMVPGIDSEEAGRRAWIALEMSVHCLSRVSEHSPEEDDSVLEAADSSVRSIIDFIAAGLTAPTA